jgi:hypothetical protein
MTEALSEQNPLGAVELSEREFHDVYSLLRMCLTAEMGIDEKVVSDGKTLLESCERILLARTDNPTLVSDMKRGFVPLFERLMRAGTSPVTTEAGKVYRVEFR